MIFCPQSAEQDTVLREKIYAYQADVVEVRHHIHANPEMAYEEFETAALVSKHLNKLGGFDVREGVGGTGVTAVLRADLPGPTIGLRADMDCLPIEEKAGKAYASKRPGFMHACGHDGHTACLLGAARVLSECSDWLRSPVKFIFQPAEEGRAGAKKMMEEGALANPLVERIFGVHGWPTLPVGSTGTRAGIIHATNDEVRIVVRGKSAHAAWPHHSVDVVVTASLIIQALQSIASRNVDPLDSVVLSLCRLEAGTSYNTLPGEAKITGTIRALSKESRDYLCERICAISENIARGMGGVADVSFHDPYPALINDKATATFFHEAIGPHLPIIEVPPVMGGEDFAFYAQEIPACFFYVGLCPAGERSCPGLHQPDFDFNDEALPIGVETFCRLALGYEPSSS